MKRYVVPIVVVVLMMAALSGVAVARSPVASDPAASPTSGFIQILLGSLIKLAVPAVALFVIQWLMAQSKVIKSKIPENILLIVEEVARLAVLAAEQSGLKDELLKEGAAKKAWVMEWAESYLRTQLGLALDLDKLGDEFWAAIVSALDKAVEATVATELNADKVLGGGAWGE